jgi:hypothetical protein
MRVILHSWCQIQRTSSSLRYVTCGPGHVHSIFSTVYFGFNIQLKVAPQLLSVSRQLNARYTANLVPNTAHILRFTLCDLWSRTYTMHLQLHIFRIQYSFERICPAIVHISTIQCALYCKLGDNYIARPPAFSMWTVVPHTYKIFTAPHIYASIFSCRYLRCYYRHHDNSIRVIQQTWCQIQRTSSSFRYVICGPGYIQSTYSSAYLVLNIQL